MKKILILLVVMVVVGIGASFLIPSVNGTTDLGHINYTETFDQDHSEYYVYFYQVDCQFCKEFEPHILEAYGDDVPIYVVDVERGKSSLNDQAWYDWDLHHKTHDVVIGEIKDGQQIFNEDESEDLYASEEGWTIGPNPDNELELIARLNRALNNKEPQTALEIEIAGTPTLIRIKEGRFAGYAEGVEEGIALLGRFGQE